MQTDNFPTDLPSNEEITMMLIEFQIYKAKQNLKEFINALDDFFESI